MGNNGDYKAFLDKKTHVGCEHGFEPIWMPDILFPFQSYLDEWSIRKGRAAIFADCGLGKTFMQLVWAENVRLHTDKPVLILTPLAVAFQTVKEGAKLGLEVKHRREGIKKGDGIVVTNYERLHYFLKDDFAGVVCDESSILKNYSGATRLEITAFMSVIPYRLLCTATAAPNDYVELGTSSEALGELERKHMLAQFFTHDGGDTGTWRLKGHARSHLFWRWMTTWSRAVRTPSDLGFDDNGFILPELTTNEHIVSCNKAMDGMLFQLPAIGLQEQRDELRRTIDERCEMAASLVNAHDGASVAWCHLNVEGEKLKQLIPYSENIQGSDSEDKKEGAFRDFANGDLRDIISKPTIAGFGLNWQHCDHMTFFPSHSYEQFYQAIRRCWRFGQKNRVTVDVISTEGQAGVLANMKRKSEAADQMFKNIVAATGNELDLKKNKIRSDKKEEIPAWL
jgi:hypothetical protein